MKIKLKASVGCFKSGDIVDLSQIELMNIIGSDGVQWSYIRNDFEFIEDEKEKPATNFKDVFGQEIKTIEFK